MAATPSFLHSDRALARLARPLVRFSHIEAAGGIVLVVATVAALVWANSPWKASYTSFWATEINLRIGSYRFTEDLAHLVNDALMAVFFFVVGLEIKHELVAGELRDRRAVALPAVAALGGMVVPAAIYAAINTGGEGSAGWGIPMATDIAFTLGVVALLGARVPAPLKVFVLALAIVDDLGAIIVIAIVYTADLEPGFLVVAAAIAAAVAVMRRVRVVTTPLYVLGGLALWLAVYESGVHPTIAGVVMGLLAPARPLQPELEAERIVDALEGRADVEVSEVRATATAIRDSVSVCERLLDALHPWTSYGIVPVFALANAGIVLSADAFTEPSAVLVGVVAGLVVGKLVGVAGFSWLAVRLGLARLPDGVRWGQLVGVAALTGIGFTVALFITGLAFTGAAATGLADSAKLGILLASVLSAIVGAAVLLRTGPSPD